MGTRQLGLFDPLTPAEQVLLADAARGYRVRFWERFLSTREAADLFASLMAVAPLEPETVVVGGKPILTRRRSCAFGNPGMVYRYVGAVRPAHPWPVELLSILAMVRQTAGCEFDFALCGLYPNGEADLGFHADDETDLEPGAPIGSLSLGAERDFVMRFGREGNALLTVGLNPGSFLTMEGTCQKYLTHSVPKRLRCFEPRLNLTFRKMRRKGK